MTQNRPSSSVPTGWPMHERSLLAGVLGVPVVAAVGIALGFTALGVLIDLQRMNGLGAIFKGCYFAGCMLAVCWVRRRGLFGPMVQPPLLMAVSVPAVVLLSGGGGDGGDGLTERLVSIGGPLLNGFPTMAVTTTAVVAIAVGRYLLQKPPAAASRSGSSRSGSSRSGSSRSGSSRSGSSRPSDRDRPPRRRHDRPEGEPRPRQERSRRPDGEPPARGEASQRREPARDEPTRGETSGRRDTPERPRRPDERAPRRDVLR